MLNGDGIDNGKKITQNNNNNKKQLCTYSTLFVHFFTVVVAPLQRETFKLHALQRKCCMFSKKKMLLVFLFAFLFTAAHFHLTGS